MSRIGKKPIQMPSGVKATISNDRAVTIEGPKGESLSHTFPREVTVTLEGSVITVTRANDLKKARAFHGMARALIANMVQGVKDPFEKILEIHGTGFGAQVQGDKIELDLGFSNKVYVKIPSGLTVEASKGRPTIVKIKGADKQMVGQLAARIRAKRPPTPYADNKGVRYRGEYIRKKAGKAFGDKK
ncbi:MAG: 50S ribosomal protein L6 [Planctomycetes bacterium]|nr:50S ribosomal protein L6 [Planctomycetota bacterium]